jgi:hypothetical protein
MEVQFPYETSDEFIVYIFFHPYILSETQDQLPFLRWSTICALACKRAHQEKLKTIVNETRLWHHFSVRLYVCELYAAELGTPIMKEWKGNELEVVVFAVECGNLRYSLIDAVSDFVQPRPSLDV